jgi:hypothetical protein
VLPGNPCQHCQQLQVAANIVTVPLDIQMQIFLLSMAGCVQICGPLGGGKTAYPDICKSVEAIASSKLAHPNIVKALRHCTVLAHGACFHPFVRFFCNFTVLYLPGARQHRESALVLHTPGARCVLSAFRFILLGALGSTLFNMLHFPAQGLVQRCGKGQPESAG